MKKVALVIGLGIIMALALTPEVIFASYSPSVAVSAATQGRSSIYGSVYGEGHRPVPDVYVELLDDVNSTIRQIKTDMSGRFQFNGLVDGRYMIKIRPGNTGYQEHTQQVVISAISSTRGANDRPAGSDTQHIDIALKLDERYTMGPFAGAPSVLFAQDVPPAAKAFYDEALAFLREKKQAQAFASLRKALEVFPDYYLALDRLGAEYAILGDPAIPADNAAATSTSASSNAAKNDPSKQEFLQAGFVLLTKATQINPRSYSSTFGLGWTQYHLGSFAEAAENLGKAANIYNKSANAYLWQAKAYRRAKMPDKAEEALKRANQINTKDADIHWELAGLYNDQKRYKESADQLELYLKNAPKGENAEKIKDLIRRLREKSN